MMNANGVRVPRWLLTAVLAAAALVSAGYGVGQKVSHDAMRMNNVELRLCRIEQALNIQPWPGCPRGTP